MKKMTAIMILIAAGLLAGCTTSLEITKGDSTLKYKTTEWFSTRSTTAKYNPETEAFELGIIREPNPDAATVNALSAAITSLAQTSGSVK